MIGPNLSAIAVRERAVTLLLIIVLLAAGFHAFLKLGRAEDPSFTIKVMTISAAWPGASAQDMQNLVADRLEKRLEELEWFDRVETQARPGVATIVLFLADRTPPSEVPGQWYQARKKLLDEASRLPRGVSGPFFNDEYSDVYFALYALTAKGMPHRELVQEAERLRADLLAVPGISKVSIFGEQSPRIFIDLSAQRMAAMGIDLQQVAASLDQQNTIAGGGIVETSGPAISLRAESPLKDDQILKAPLTIAGRTIALSDIATVRRGYEEPPNFLVRHDGEPALVLGMVMRKGYNGTALGEALEEKVTRLRAALPLGLSLEQAADQAANISDAYG